MLTFNSESRIVVTVALKYFTELSQIYIYFDSFRLTTTSFPAVCEANYPTPVFKE